MWVQRSIALFTVFAYSCAPRMRHALSVASNACAFVAACRSLRVNQQAVGYACSRLMNTMPSINQFTGNVQRSTERLSHACHEYLSVFTLQSAGGVRNIFTSQRIKGPAVRDRRLLELIVRLFNWLELTPLSHQHRDGQSRLLLCSTFDPSTTVIGVELSKLLNWPTNMFAIVWVRRWDAVTGDVSVDGLSGPMMHRFD